MLQQGEGNVAQAFCPRCGRHWPAFIGEDIAPEALVDEVVENGLAQHRRARICQKPARFSRQAQSVMVAGQRCRCCEFQVRRGQRARHFRGGHRMPVPVEIFVREVVAALAVHFREPRRESAVRAKIFRVGLQHRLRELQGGVDPCSEAFGLRLGQIRVQRQQMTQRNFRSPAGQAVVADEEAPAGRQTAPQDFHDPVAVFRGNPRPRAVHRDHVELRQVFARGKFLERLGRQAHRRPRGSGKSDRALAAWSGLKSMPQNSPRQAAAWMLIDTPWPNPSSRYLGPAAAPGAAAPQARHARSIRDGAISGQ